MCSNLVRCTAQFSQLGNTECYTRHFRVWQGTSGVIPRVPAPHASDDRVASSASGPQSISRCCPLSLGAKLSPSRESTTTSRKDAHHQLCPMSSALPVLLEHFCTSQCDFAYGPPSRNLTLRIRQLRALSRCPNFSYGALLLESVAPS